MNDIIFSPSLVREIATAITSFGGVMMSQYTSQVVFNDLDEIRCNSPFSESGYYGVYRHRSGWIAKAFRYQVAPVQRTPLEAARLLVAWWQGRFGTNWKLFFRGRKKPPYQVIKRQDGTFKVRVWWLGIPVWLSLNKAKNGDVFAMKEDAEDAIEEWKTKVFGLMVPICHLWLRRH